MFHDILLTLILSSKTNEDLLVASAVPYLAAGENRHMLPVFEAAHSVMLAVLTAPQSAEITAKHLPFYIDALFSVFPHNLSPRQFRLAFKTLMRVTAPPSAISATHPDLPATLLELVYHRALIDALPMLPISLLEEWLPLCADLLNQIDDDGMRETVKARYWEVLVSGEMDAERSGVAVQWWTTRGGREQVLFGREGLQHGMMSGALPVEERVVRESKL
jgi:hypothetical protein